MEDKEKIEKAYGGCTKCYGKGYSTEQQGQIGNSRVIIRGPKIVYNPCSCERGKQIKELMKSAAQEREEEILALLDVLEKDIDPKTSEGDEGYMQAIFEVRAAITKDSPNTKKD